MSNEISKHTNQLQNYIDAINNVAIVIELDNDFNILNVNDTFIKRTGYTKEELINSNLDDILKGSRTHIFLKELKELLNKNETVKYSNKFITKQNEEFFVKNTYINLDHENVKHLAIGFSITSEVVEKKEFNKKVVEKIREANQKEQESKKTIMDMTSRLEQYESYLKSLKRDTELFKEKVLIKSRQIVSFEEQLATIDAKYQKLLASKNKEIEVYNKASITLKIENEKLQKQNEDLRKSLLKLQKELEK